MPHRSSTRRRMLKHLSRADLINAVELCYPGIPLRCFSKFIEDTPSDPTIIDLLLYSIVSVFLFRGHDISWSSYLLHSNLEVLLCLLL